MEALEIGLAVRAFQDNEACGDAIGYWPAAKMSTICVADGLGHGKEAEKASKAAISYISNHLDYSLEEIFEGCNFYLNGTRGAALAIAQINFDEKELAIAGVGNNRMIVVRETTIRIPGNYGIVGGGFKKLKINKISFKNNFSLIMFTDGMLEFIDISKYIKDKSISSQIIANQILADYYIGKDDVAIMVANMKDLR